MKLFIHENEIKNSKKLAVFCFNYEFLKLKKNNNFNFKNNKSLNGEG